MQPHEKLSQELEDDPAFILIQKAEDFVSGFEDDEMQEGINELIGELRAFINERRKHKIVSDSWRCIDIEYSDAPTGFHRNQHLASYIDKDSNEALYSAYLSNSINEGDITAEELAFLKKVEKASVHYGAFFFRIINTPEKIKYSSRG